MPKQKDEKLTNIIGEGMIKSSQVISKKPLQGMDIVYTWKNSLYNKHKDIAIRDVYKELETIIRQKKLYKFCNIIKLDLSKASPKYWNKING